MATVQNTKPLSSRTLVELYLTQYIEDRKSPSGKVIAGARKQKGQSETRRTLYGDVIPKLAEMAGQSHQCLLILAASEAITDCRGLGG